MFCTTSGIAVAMIWPIAFSGIRGRNCPSASSRQPAPTTISGVPSSSSKAMTPSRICMKDDSRLSTFASVTSSRAGEVSIFEIS